MTDVVYEDESDEQKLKSRLTGSDVLATEGGRENYCSVCSVFPICLTWVLVNRLGLRCPGKVLPFGQSLHFFLTDTSLGRKLYMTTELL